MSHQQLLDQILQHPRIAPELTGQRTRDGDEIVWCIFHDDGNGKPPHEPNLHIGPKGYICFRCKRSGSLQKLARHLGISRRGGARELVKVWDYCAVDGSAVVFQKCRFQTPDGKTYGLRRAAPPDWQECLHRAECQKGKRDCYDGWIWSLAKRPCSPAPPRVLYNHRALLVSADQPVHIAEGEQCCDALNGLDLLAVCNFDGAGKWRPEYSEALRDREVVIWVDADAAGRDHGRLVAQSLRGKATSIGVIDLYSDRSDGSDVADWIAERRAARQDDSAIRAELESLVARAAERQPRCWRESSPSSSPRGGDDDDNAPPVELCTLAKPGPRQWVVGTLIPASILTVLFGGGGLAKSLLAMLIGEVVARGLSIFGWPVMRGRVLYLDWELDQEEQTRRAYRVAAGLGYSSPAPGLFYRQMDVPLSRALPRIRAWLTELDISLVILDSFGLSTLGDPAAARDVIPLLGTVSRLPCTSLFIDHVRNLHPGEGGDDLNPFGSVYKFNIGRSLLRVVAGHRGEASLCITLRQTKSNFGALGAETGLRVSFEEERVCFERISAPTATTSSDPHQGSSRGRVYQALPTAGAASAEELAVTTGLALGTVKNALTGLRHDGLARPASRGRWTRADSSSPSPPLRGGDDDDGGQSPATGAGREGTGG